MPALTVRLSGFRIRQKQKEGGTYSPRDAEIIDTKFKLDQLITVADLELKDERLTRWAHSPEPAEVQRARSHDPLLTPCLLEVFAGLQFTQVTEIFFQRLTSVFYTLLAAHTDSLNLPSILGSVWTELGLWHSKETSLFSWDELVYLIKPSTFCFIILIEYFLQLVFFEVSTNSYWLSNLIILLQVCFCFYHLWEFCSQFLISA